MRRLLTVLLLTLVALGAAEARAQRRRAPAVVSDLWTEPAPGLRYLQRTTSTPTRIHAVVVDLRAPGVRVLATPHDSRWTTVPEFAASHDLEVAINGGFWGGLQDARGLAAGGGAAWPDVAPDPDFATFALLRDDRASIHRPEEPPDLEAVREAVSGRPLLVWDGEPDEAALADFPSAELRAPRTAIGVSRDGATVYLVVVDGRQRDSRGLSLLELARLLVELGAHRALNLDGGGSSEMYVRRAGGVVSVPSRGRWEIAVDEMLGAGESTRTAADGTTEVFVRGREREVMNHVGVVAPRPDVPVAPHTSAVGGQLAIEAPPPPPAPLPPRVRLGPLRETLARASVVAVPLAACALTAWLARRWLARRRARG